MLKFGLLGIGQGGTSIAEYALTQGFKVVIANTAQVDLEQAKYISKDCKIYLGGHGAGRDREVGSQAMIANAEKILEKCQQEFADCDALFVAATGGGGTGSGGLPIGLEILMSFHKYVGAMIILPDDQESPKAKMNTLECFSQISEFENLGSVFIIDNQRAKELNPSFSRRVVYQATNKELIDLIVELNQLTDQQSYVSNFDASDLLGIIQERGYTLISKTEYLSDGLETPFDIATKVRSSWNQSYQPSFNDGQIMKGAILGRIPERTSARVDVNLIFQETGIPYDFNDVYFFPEDSRFIDQMVRKYKNTFYTVLSGLSFPQSRLDQMNCNIKAIEEKLMDNFKTAQTQKFETENWSTKFSKHQKVVNMDASRDKPQKIDLLNKLAKYK